MTALARIEAGLRAIGYRPESLIHDYSFADVLSEAGEEQCVALAAFTQVPESYRSAAFGVITGTHDSDAAGRSVRRSCSRSALKMSGSGGSARKASHV